VPLHRYASTRKHNCHAHGIRGLTTALTWSTCRSDTRRLSSALDQHDGGTGISCWNRGPRLQNSHRCCLNPVQFHWIENDTVLKTDVNATSTTLTYTFNLGNHTITLDATIKRATGSANVTVSVIDTRPTPDERNRNAKLLWPPKPQIRSSESQCNGFRHM